MKKIFIFISLYFLLFTACKKKEVKHFSRIFGNYQIVNSAQKEWFIHADIASWQEYNKLHNFRNNFDIIWYSPSDFDLIFRASSDKKSKYKITDRVACKFKTLNGMKLLRKKLDNVKVDAVLKRSAPKQLNQWFSTMDKDFENLSSIALWQLWTLKTKKYESFYSSSALKTQLSLANFVSIQNQLHKMFGGILWFKALKESYQENNLGFAMDFQLGLASAKSPLISHFQWNKSYKIVSMSLQSSKANQSVWVNKKIKQFWLAAKNGNWRNIYLQSTDNYKKLTNYDEFTRQMSILLKLNNPKIVHLASTEIDIASYGNNWAYFFEAVQKNSWIGINFIQHFNDAIFRLDKIVYID